jgi:NitT/TauT family transport system substrate-binding protein
MSVILDETRRRARAARYDGGPRTLLGAALALALAQTAAGCARGEPPPEAGALATVRFAVGATSIPVPFGISKGFFAEHGIAVRLLHVPGGVEAVTAAAADEVDAGSYGSPIVVGAAAGVPIRIVASPPAPGQHFVLVARPGYFTVADLRGKRVSPGGPGQGTRQAFDVIARAHGLAPSDFQRVDAGDTAVSLAALQSGSVDAVLTTELHAYKAEAEGFGKVIARAADYFGRYQHSYVFATQRLIDRRPDVLRRFLAGYRKTIAYIKANPGEAIAFGVRELELEEAPLRSVLSREIPTWDPSGQVDLVGTDNAIRILKTLGELDPSVSVTAAQLADLRFLAP